MGVPSLKWSLPIRSHPYTIAHLQRCSGVHAQRVRAVPRSRGAHLSNLGPLPDCCPLKSRILDYYFRCFTILIRRQRSGFKCGKKEEPPCRLILKAKHCLHTSSSQYTVHQSNLGLCQREVGCELNSTGERDNTMNHSAFKLFKTSHSVLPGL